MSEIDAENNEERNDADTELNTELSTETDDTLRDEETNEAEGTEVPNQLDEDETHGEIITAPAKENDDILSWIITIAAAAVVAFIINTFLIVNATVPTGSMENTIMPKDRIVAFRWAYIFGEYKRGDILVFKNPDNEEELYVKRLIGLPGDTVTIIDGRVYINDSSEPLDEQYVNGVPIGSFGPYEVPEDSYFMLGDNRNNSKDARFWINTYVSDEKVLGKVYFRYYPMPKMLTGK